MPTTTRVANDQNMTKNRYKDVVCADQTRVVLKYGLGRNAGDYIHANWLTSYIKMICTQGPLDTTIGDFWRMVWQEKVTHIVMLCRTEEEGKVKCSRYWPRSVAEPMVVGQLSICNTGTERDGKPFTTTKISVSAQGAQVLQVSLHQWASWPDRAVPESPSVPLRMIRMIRDDPEATTVVHCSASIGRTGTLVVIEMCVHRLLDGGRLDVLHAVKTLRRQRMGCVQTETQYIFVYYAVLHYLHLKGRSASSSSTSSSSPTSPSTALGVARRSRDRPP